MKQNSKLEFYVPLIISVIMAAAIKIPTLALPYCYSESQILCDSILYMKYQGLNLVFCENAVQMPDLFCVIYSYIIKLPFMGPLQMHAFSLIFSALCIWTAYNFGKFFFSIQAGVMAASLMCVQNVFIAQSGLVVPTMMLNCCIIGGLYMFFREKYAWCLVLQCIATLIDITGLVSAAFILVAYYKIQFKEWSVAKNVMFALPILIWVAYEIASLLLCSKMTFRAMDFSIENFARNLYFIFVAQYRFVVTGIMIVVLIVNLKNKNVQFFVKDMAHNGMVLFALIFVVNSLFTDSESWNLTCISMLTIFTGCLISTVPISYYGKYMLTCLMIALCAFSATDRSKVTDSYVNYKSKVKVDRETVKVVQSTIAENEAIHCDRYLKMFLNLKELGYIPTTKNYNLITKPKEFDNYIWTIYSSFNPDADMEAIRDDINFKMRSSIYIGDYANEIYEEVL